MESKKQGRRLKLWRLSNWRRVVQVATVLLFLYFLFEIRFPWEVDYKPTQYLRFDFLANIFGLLIGVGVITGVFFIVIALFSLIFNRTLCGWLCPLGALLDGFRRLFVKPIGGGRVKIRKRGYGWKFILLNVFVVLILFGIPFMWLWEPMSILPRSTTTIFFPPFNAGMDIVSRFLRERNFLPGAGRFINNNMLDPWQPHFLHAVVLLIIFAIPFALEFRFSRAFCRVLCPLGASMSYLSPIGLIKRRVSDKCIECLACQKGCRMGAIYNSGKDYNSAECVLCGDCIDTCPTRAVSFGVKPGFETKMHQAITESNVEPKWDGGRFSLSRRAFVASVGVGVVSVPLIRLADGAAIRPADHIRPPGAVEEDLFKKRCLKCGACMKVCPTHGLQPTMLETGVAGFFSPHLVPVIGECEFTCNSCGLVCPSRAIEPIEKEEKAYVPIGVAYFKRDLCIPTAIGNPCYVCEEHCPTDPKSILMREQLVVTKDMEQKMVPVPYIVEETCIGCGICERVCPVKEERAVKCIHRGERRGRKAIDEYKDFRKEWDATRVDLGNVGIGGGTGEEAYQGEETYQGEEG